MEDPENPGSSKEEQESKGTSGTGSRQEENVVNNMQAHATPFSSPLWVVNAASEIFSELQRPEVQMQGLLFRVCCSTVA